MFFQEVVCLRDMLIFVGGYVWMKYLDIVDKCDSTLGDGGIVNRCFLPQRRPVIVLDMAQEVFGVILVVPVTVIGRDVALVIIRHRRQRAQSVCGGGDAAELAQAIF